ncbi:hypothetical protein [Pseudomonas sp. zjy_8]|uniref:hypothetical protein n=1 Tax=Pseudomonas sp. GLN_2 TaxID=3367180 RepID=UPI00370BB712
MHEMEALRPLLESALVQVQMPAEPRNFALRLVNVPEGPANSSRSFTVAAATAFAGKPAHTSVSNQLFLAKVRAQRSVCATLQFLLANQPALPLLYIDTVNRNTTSKKA